MSFLRDPSAAVGPIVRALLGIAAAAALVAPSVGGCAQNPTNVAVRSLERSGRSTFVCLGPPPGPNDNSPSPIYDLSECSSAAALNQADFGIKDPLSPEGKWTLPHLYGLVTQTTRGEVAVVDLTATDTHIVDEDLRTPGNNFLPVGGHPVDVVASPGGTASFASVAEIGRPGIFAIPSARIRPCPATNGLPYPNGCKGRDVPELSTWPACALPSAPGEMLLIADPAAVDGSVRARCPTAGGDPSAGAYGSGDTSPGTIGAEQHGRQKLVVTMPDAGGIAVIDADTLLDPKQTPPGSFNVCPIDFFLPLTVDLPPPTVPPQPTPDPYGACTNPPQVEPRATPSFTARPSGLAYDGTGRLYVGDLAAPVVHVIDLMPASGAAAMPTPCDLVERLPLLPTAIDDPKRIVTTNRLAVTAPATATLKSYLYAIDVVDGSAMAFDVGADSTTRTPIQRAHPEWNPFEARDRVSFLGAAKDVTIVSRDIPAQLPIGNGTAPAGTRCDPDSTHSCSQADLASGVCDYGALYRTTPDYTAGAAPLKLRGTFAFILLSAGAVAAVDIDDLDGRCRVPKAFSPLLGCPPANYAGPQTNLWTQNERSCNVVLPNAPRSASFVLSTDTTGQHEPGVQTFPILYDATGTLVSIGKASPRMVATVPASSSITVSLAVANADIPIDATGQINLSDGPKHALAMNLEDPRAQVSDQSWAIVYEGSLPGFQDRLAALQLEGKPDDGVYDPNSRFCDAGVQSEEAVRETLKAEGKLTDAEIAKTAPTLADYVQIMTDILPADDLFWSHASCDYNTCQNTFGSSDVPRPNRDLRILEAYQDHVLVESRGSTDESLIRCCFPSVVGFNVRAGGQWVALGQGSGFLHHVIVDSQGRCRNSCDPVLSRMNGRVLTVDETKTSVVKDGDPGAFINPMFRFAILSGSGGLQALANARDYQFVFTTEGSFTPLVINLSAAVNTSDIEPQSMRYVSSTGELAIADGSLEGLMMVSLASVNLSRQFF